MTTSRLAVVSNQDSRVHYQGEWSLTDASTFQNIGNFGPPLESSLHTTTTISSFSFGFNGSYIGVLGTIASGQSSSQPTLQCFVDGVNFPSSVGGPANNVHLCTTMFTDGLHELLVNVSATEDSPFYLDNLQYEPSADVPLNNATVIIPKTDPSISYSPEWTQLGGFTANMTEATNAFANVSFIGNRLGWFGIIPGGEPPAPSRAEYSVDGTPFVSFNLPGLPAGSNTTTIFNIPFFTTDVLQQGLHTLTVRYLGNDSTTPLTLNNLLIVNASAPSTTEKPTNSSSPTPLPNPQFPNQSNNRKSNSTGAFVGGFVGGFVGLGLIIVSLFLYRRHSRRKEVNSVVDGITPFQLESAPNPQTRHSGLGSNGVTSFRTKGGIQRTAVPTINENEPLLLNGDSSGQGSTPTATTSAGGVHNRTESNLSNPVPSDEPLPPRGNELHNSSNFSSSINASLAGGRSIQIQHEDSGLRINPSQNRVVELPPTYTIS